MMPAEDGRRGAEESRRLREMYKRQIEDIEGDIFADLLGQIVQRDVAARIGVVEPPVGVLLDLSLIHMLTLPTKRIASISLVPSLAHTCISSNVAFDHLPHHSHEPHYTH